MRYISKIRLKNSEIIKESNKKKNLKEGAFFQVTFFLLLKDNLLLGSYHFHSNRTVLMTTQGENLPPPSGVNTKKILPFKRAWPAMLAQNKLKMYHKLINSTLWSLKCQLFFSNKQFYQNFKPENLIFTVIVFEMFI